MVNDNLRNRLIQWFMQYRRPLPWRQELPDGTRDPYRVVVSEIMLQQTQVQVVQGYFERWMQLFPDLNTLATAQEDAVLQVWTGLGYYRRAKALHRLAKAVMLEHHGIFPAQRNDLLKLPGIGPYTCGAIQSLAFGQNAAILDGNLIRVFCRFHAWQGDPAKEPLKSQLWEYAALWAAESAKQSNEALMELGALCCKPKNPDCQKCPLADDCQAFVLDQTQDFPQNTKKSFVEWNGAQLWIYRNTQILLVKNGSNFFGQDFWMPPLFENGQIPQVGHSQDSASIPVKHSITKFKITMNNQCIAVDHDWHPPQSWGQAKWTHVKEIEETLHFSLALKGWAKIKGRLMATLGISVP